MSSHITAGNIAEQEYNNKLDMVREFLRAREVQGRDHTPGAKLCNHNYAPLRECGN